MRHQKRKFTLDRKTGPRKALIKTLADQLVLYSAIETTEAKAKALRPYIEKIVTKGKKPTLANIRLIKSKLKTPGAAKKLVMLISKKYFDRNGGYTRIVKLGFRKGDAAKIVKIEFV